MKTKYISFKGGRLGNQLYYSLQAFKSTTEQLNLVYSITGCENPKHIYDMMCKLGLSKLISIDNQPEIEINNYCQKFGVDFLEQDLNNFINNFILKSELFNDINKNSRNEKTIAINIRNGDYLTQKPIYHNCFNREDYLNKSIYSKDIKNVTDATVFSDDIPLCKKLYHGILKNRFNNIEYFDETDILTQFKELTYFRNKIIWNSTFSFWASFIGDVIYRNSGICICPSKFNIKTHIKEKVKPNWKIIDVI